MDREAEINRFRDIREATEQVDFRIMLTKIIEQLKADKK